VIKFYFNLSPNPMKVALLLEELGLPYEPVPVDTRKGEQFNADYLALNPNAKVPVIIDGDTTVFDSNGILLYLAEKNERFLGEPSAVRRGELLSWLMFVASGVGPYSGQAVHFQHYAPGDNAYAVNRYDFEVERHYKVLEARLATQAFLVGSGYSIADMALWGWARMLPHVMNKPEAWSDFPNVKRWFDEISARPAAAGVERLREKFKFKADMDEDARRHMFPQLARLGLK
jgi:GSH-dependent disulfide-bond oxidoreductase